MSFHNSRGDSFSGCCCCCCCCRWWCRWWTAFCRDNCSSRCFFRWPDEWLIWFRLTPLLRPDFQLLDDKTGCPVTSSKVSELRTLFELLPTPIFECSLAGRLCLLLLTLDLFFCPFLWLEFLLALLCWCVLLGWSTTGPVVWSTGLNTKEGTLFSLWNINDIWLLPTGDDWSMAAERRTWSACSTKSKQGRCLALRQAVPFSGSPDWPNPTCQSSASRISAGEKGRPTGPRPARNGPSFQLRSEPGSGTGHGIDSDGWCWPVWAAAAFRCCCWRR